MKTKYLIDEGRGFRACQNIGANVFLTFYQTVVCHMFEEFYLKTNYLIDEGKELRSCQNIGGERGQKESGKVSSLGGNYSCNVW